MSLEHIEARARVIYRRQSKTAVTEHVARDLAAREWGFASYAVACACIAVGWV